MVYVLIEIPFAEKLHFLYAAETEDREAVSAREHQTEEQISREGSERGQPPGEEPAATEGTSSEGTESALDGSRPPGDPGKMQIPSPMTVEVSDFIGSSHVRYPIQVPPARAGLSPDLSLSYTSAGGNGWLGVGWDLSVAFIQRKGIRKAVPTYDDSKDIFELNLGEGLQELVPIGNGRYQLRTEGAYLYIQYYSSPHNYWDVWDKSGNKLRFGSSANSRIGTVKEPDASGNTYRWCLDQVKDPKTNYMDLLYWKDQEGNQTFQIYLNEIRYNAQVSSGLGHNHRIMFNRESVDRNDLVYNYRGGFKMLTRKRLSWIEIYEIKASDILVRKYHIQYPPSGTRSLLSSITHHGDNGSFLPPTQFSYQTHNPGFQETVISWHKPTSITRNGVTTSFTYDGTGQRVKKVYPGHAVYYFGDLYEIRDGIRILHIFAGPDGRVASIRDDGNNQFYHPNHLGSASVITDSNGNRKEQMEYSDLEPTELPGFLQGLLILMDYSLTCFTPSPTRKKMTNWDSITSKQGYTIRCWGGLFLRIQQFHIRKILNP